jgi:DNA-binding NtrC family response regulator
MSIATRTLTVDGRTVRVVRRYALAIREPKGTAREEVVSGTRVRIGSREGNDVVVADDAVSRLHCEITVEDAGYRLRDLESTNGTFVDEMRVHDVYLRPGATIRLGGTTLVFAPGAEETTVPAATSDRFGSVYGASVAMRELFATLERAAPSDATILIEGETGTGKEVVARAIHDQSRRSAGPFAVFDCAAAPANLIESELFGHEKGAFTGATSRRIGRLEEAEGGTLFIDELGELPLELQPKLLRALQERQVRRVGGRDTIPVDIRIVAATNRDLGREINRGAFREDLYYRLAVVRVTLPPLRERREDVRGLVEHFIRRAHRLDAGRAERTLAGISESNWRALESHPWPGNVRQLENVIARTLALSAGEEVEHIGLPTAPRRSQEGSSASGSLSIDLDRNFVDQKADVVAAFEKAYLEGQLDRHDGNISRAAAAAGMDRMYFKRVLKKHQ